MPSWLASSSPTGSSPAGLPTRPLLALLVGSRPRPGQRRRRGGGRAIRLLTALITGAVLLGGVAPAAAAAPPLGGSAPSPSPASPAAVPPASPAAVPPAAPPLAGDAQRAIVKMLPGHDRAEVPQLAAASVHHLPLIDAFVVDVPAGQDPHRWLAGVRNHPAVEYAVVDTKRASLAQEAPNDPYFDRQWGLANTGQLVPYGEAGEQAGRAGLDVGARGAWRLGTASARTMIAVLDTGIDITHPDLQGAIWTNPREVPGNRLDDDGNGYVDDVHGWNFLTGKADVSAGAASGHGTHVAGVIAALTGNQLGVAGLADGATILPVPFIGAEGGYDSDAIRAITYATSQGATIINASWGASIAEAPAAANPALADAIRACGCLFVTAAGNNGHDMDEPGYQVYPAAFGLSNELSVAAVDNQGQLAPFSDFGRRAIDLAAPGVGILSTVPGGYGWGDGTSMATPYVTATAALLTAADPSLTPAKLANLLRATARPVGSLAGLVRSGGMVSASAGIAVAVSGSTRTLTGLPRVPRIAGQDRYDTAAQVAGQLPPGQPVAYLATGTGFADASAGAVLAARDGAPLLLTEPDQLPAATAQALSQARPERLVVLGDDLAVSDQVARAAASYTTTGTWTRLAGQNRYETAALVAGQFEPGVAEVAIATGEDFADALAAVPVAAAHRSPVLLAPPTGLPQPVADVLRQLSPQRVLIVGGEASLPPAVAQAAGRAAGAPVSRVAGVDRYDTAAKLALRLPAPTPVAYIATGHAFPDAVTGAVLAAAERGPLLLTTPTRLAPASARTLAALRPARIYVLGGATAVSGRVAVGLSALTR